MYSHTLLESGGEPTPSPSAGREQTGTTSLAGNQTAAIKTISTLGSQAQQLYLQGHQNGHTAVKTYPQETAAIHVRYLQITEHMNRVTAVRVLWPDTGGQFKRQNEEFVSALIGKSPKLISKEI